MKLSKYRNLNWFMRLALEGKPLTVYGEGLQRRDYIFKEDLAEAAFQLALTSGTAGRVFNLGSGTNVAWSDMAYMVTTAVPGTEGQQVEWPADRYFVETGAYLSDILLLTQAAGWQPKTLLPEGIARTVAFFRKN